MRSTEFSITELGDLLVTLKTQGKTDLWSL